MDTRKDIALLRWEELLVLVAEQQRQITQLHGQLAEATTTIKALQVEVDRLKREQKRPAAPLSKATRVRQPKPPGRKPGSGTFSFRQTPKPGEITEPPVEVRVTLEGCPGCGHRLVAERVDLAYITDIPIQFGIRTVWLAQYPVGMKKNKKITAPERDQIAW